MKLPRHQRGRLLPRSLDTLEGDYLRFHTNANSDIRKAKDYNNVISRPFFNIPLNQVRTPTCTHTCTLSFQGYYTLSCKPQVCPPGLHITLGIFYRLWSLLEGECHQLDLELATRTAPQSMDRTSFNEYSSTIKELSQQKEKKMELENYTTTLSTAIAHVATEVQNPNSNPLLSQLQEEVTSVTRKIQDFVGFNFYFLNVSSGYIYMYMCTGYADH